MKGIDGFTARYKKSLPNHSLAESAAKRFKINLTQQLGTSEIKCDDMRRLIYGKRQAERFAQSRTIQSEVWLYAFCPAANTDCQDEVRKKIWEKYKFK